MKLKLQLGEKQFIWALVEPLGKGFIKNSNERGYQAHNLIVSQTDTTPVEVELEDYPGWAKSQVLSAIKSGQLVNTGDKIDRPVATEAKATVADKVVSQETTEAIETAQKATKAKRSRKTKTDK